MVSTIERLHVPAEEPYECPGAMEGWGGGALWGHPQWSHVGRRDRDGCPQSSATQQQSALTPVQGGEERGGEGREGEGRGGEGVDERGGEGRGRKERGREMGERGGGGEG